MAGIKKKKVTPKKAVAKKAVPKKAKLNSKGRTATKQKAVDDTFGSIAQFGEKSVKTAGSVVRSKNKKEDLQRRNVQLNAAARQVAKSKKEKNTFFTPNFATRLAIFDATEKFDKKVAKQKAKNKKKK